ncbi:MAG: NAD(P)/FAD-dependent oxidoreductase [Candidatus Lokiarchaeota archaeon]|nr:NAD(P)/FAD-dependent oxidoreductase [Candidatus Lokiarchaeota archaeon]
MKNIIIIGSGIGGSGIGGLLATNTKSNITLFEQNNWVGGRCGSYIKKDSKGREWICDVGTHIFGNCDKGPLGTILKKIGKENEVEWSYCRDPGPRISMMGQIMSFGLKKVTKDGEVKKKSKPSKKKSFKDLLTEISYEDTYNYDDMPLDKYLKANKLNVFMYTLQAGLMYGTGPQTTSAGEFLRCSKKNAETMSMGYVKGGCKSIPTAYCNAITENGGKIFMQTKVNRIIVEDGVAKGVEVGANKEYHEADLIIANSDIKTTMLKMVGENHLDKEYATNVKNLTWGGQVCSLKLGIDIHVTDDKWLNYIPKMTEKDVKAIDFSNMEGQKDLKAEDIPERSVLMIVPLSNLDPALAPEGCQNLHCVTPTLGAGGTMEERKKISKKWEECSMNTLLELWPEIDGHILWTDFVSDVFLETKLGKEGAGTGVGQTIGQVGKKRPSVISPIKNLYLTGGDAGGWGVGTELAANSALELYDILINQKIV